MNRSFLMLVGWIQGDSWKICKVTWSVNVHGSQFSKSKVIIPDYDCSQSQLTSVTFWTTKKLQCVTQYSPDWGLHYIRKKEWYHLIVISMLLQNLSIWSASGLFQHPTTKVRATVPLMHHTLVPKGLHCRVGRANSFTNFCNHARSNDSATALVANVQLWPITQQCMRH